MTPLDPDQETLAQRIAAGGHDALIEHLHGAYAEVASANGDMVSISHERIDALAQAAADRADGLQWRRALATVAARELQIELTQALSHPLVARAQQLAGAPSYEESLAELVARATQPGAAAPPTHATPGHDPQPETAIIPGQEELFNDDQVDQLQETAEHHVSFDDDYDDVEDDHRFDGLDTIEARLKRLGDSNARGPEFDRDDHDDDELRIGAYHLGGVANLPTGEDHLSLRLSPVGLDILRDDDRIIGRLGWEEIDELETPSPRSRLLRRERGHAQLTVRTAHGDASFGIPAFSPEELRERLDPLIARYGRR